MRPSRPSDLTPRSPTIGAERRHLRPAPLGADGARKMLVIACGALAREVLALSSTRSTSPACPRNLHNHPERIPEAMRAKIRANRASYDEILCLYGDCGTGGELDRVLAEEGVTRIEGAHCYAFYAGEEAFARAGRGGAGHVLSHRFSRPPFRRARHQGARPRPLPAIARRLFRRLPPRRPSGAGRRSRYYGEGQGRGRPAGPRLRAPLHRP